MKALRRSHTSSSSSASPSPSSSSASSSWIHLRSILIIASSNSSSSLPSSTPHIPHPDRGSLKSPWSRRKRKHALSRRQWSTLFSQDGKLRDGGVKFLKKVRSAGVDPSIRAEVWPFLLGVYDLHSSEEKRNATKRKKRKEYEKLRRQCRQIMKPCNKSCKEIKGIGEISNAESPIYDEDPESPGSEGEFGARPSISIWGDDPDDCNPDQRLQDEVSASNSGNMEEKYSGITQLDPSTMETESSDTESSDEDENDNMPTEESIETDPKFTRTASIKRGDFFKSNRTSEDFTTWQRIIRKDALRANAEWVLYFPTQAEVSEGKAHQSALAVGLQDYDHLEPCMIYHAARLVAILEAYALYDPEIGYCQGMSDLLSPIISVIEEDHEAFWCFVGFMRKARHNFRLDEVGIRRQLSMVSKIIKYKDSHLYRHLEKLRAEDCFFVYRMVVVMFRRELSFEQTLCLWEVMWADQAAIRAGIGKSVWGRIRLRAPPTDDLLLYAIAASVLQRRKLIIERYSSMDEILRECNGMTGQLDVWKLLNDAHDLVVTLHDKI